MQYTKKFVEAEEDVVTRLEVTPGKGFMVSRRKLPELRDTDVELAPSYSFISAGTELSALRVVTAEAPESHPPFTLGYSQCGVVSRVGDDVSGIVPGDRVVAIGAGAFHAQRTVVAQNLVVPLPEGVRPDVASAMAMYCFALEGVYKSSPRIGENAVVFGAGMMGQVTARLLALAGCRVSVMDTTPFRLGFLPPSIPGFLVSEEGWEKLRVWSQPYGVEHASICFGGDATDTINRLKHLMSCSPDGIPHGKVVFLGGARLTVLMASNMGNIQFISSAKAGPGYRDPAYESGNAYPAAYVPHPVRRNMEVLLELIQDGRLSGMETLITHRFPFAEAQKAYEQLQSSGGDSLMGVLLDYADPKSK